jgi:hypothetical protein
MRSPPQVERLAKYEALTTPSDVDCNSMQIARGDATTLLHAAQWYEEPPRIRNRKAV